jgi:hypothetical protein
MKLTHFIGLSLAVVFIFSAGLYMILNYSNYYAVDIINFEIIVDHDVGFNLDKDALYFGAVIPPGKARRNITIENSFQRIAHIRIVPNGDIRHWIVPANDSFYLDSGESQNLEIVAHVPADASFGNYSGTISVYYEK